MDRKTLLMKGLVKFVSGVVIVGLLLFLSAGTFQYVNAWIFMALLFIPMICAGSFLLFKSPDMLNKRLNTKETQLDQKIVILFSAIIFIGGFVLAGLNFRFGWLVIPRWIVIAASVLLLFSYGLWAEVMRENAYLSRTVEIQENQKVVDTGLYGIVRHPMYTATLLLYFSIPIVLGSVVSFVLFLGFIPVFVGRILGEEKVLEDGLVGYREYKQRVKYRLIPFVW